MHNVCYIHTHTYTYIHIHTHTYTHNAQTAQVADDVMLCDELLERAKRSEQKEQQLEAAQDAEYEAAYKELKKKTGKLRICLQKN